MIAFRNDPEAQRLPEVTPSPKPAKLIGRKFITGSEWLYYKVYTGVKAADSLLANVLYPLAERFQECGWTDRFFFIRYSDPHAHIRFRFHLTDTDHLGLVIQELHMQGNCSIIFDERTLYDYTIRHFRSVTAELLE